MDWIEHGFTSAPTQYRLYGAKHADFSTLLTMAFLSFSYTTISTISHTIHTHIIEIFTPINRLLFSGPHNSIS